MARGGAVGALAGVLSDPKRTPAGALWAARLLRVLSEEPTTAQELASCPELLLAVAALLRAPPAYSRSGMTEQDRVAAAWRATKGLDSTKSYFKWADYHEYQGMWGEGSPDAGRDIGVEAAAAAPGVAEPVTKAQAHMAWMLGRLAVSTRGSAREAVRALGVSAGVIPALVVMLRESQRNQGVGFNLGSVLQHNSQAAAAFALQALCAGHAPNRRAALDVLALEAWLGHNISVDLSPAGLDTVAADLQAPGVMGTLDGDGSDHWPHD
ncbi:hypothetical protein MNEG_12713 [Monoraphidium neglectum]|uniref:Uncharacterized protein n=1 Tax=Monoraphidium neglectum TaxID=145388 RepID=A0A0D2MJY9_9CHLO|nr:hypothetical protein MNEG_12713 [Monoraphidium neglectum]KIY95250.1 hypothetical protein MNEG_12713 [Monoraphidium neglectum]|eukprot:XP_013894270.1 hypothetical protein MNEG_12713 [Monoraphidium neglectum]